MLAALLKTFRTIGRPYFLGMLLLSLVVTAVAFGVLFVIVGYLLSATAFVSMGWLDTILDWTAGLGTVVLVWFLFPVVLPLVASFFLEQVAGRIEQREYSLQPSSSLPFWPEVLEGLKFAGFSLLLNLLALPFYFVPVLFPFVYYGLNSYLLGREFFETVAGRHVGRKAASDLRREHRLQLMLSGLIIALCATLPIAALFAPFVGVALSVHFFHAMTKTKVESHWSATVP
ncbi:MAG: EI24 domain-containing protein [Geminicoccaceae bacterium]